MSVQYVMHRGFRENLRIIWATVRLTTFPPDDSCRS